VEIINQQDQESFDLFQSWYNSEVPGLFSLRSEYFLEDLKALAEDHSVEKSNVIVKWLEAAYFAGYTRGLRVP